MFCTLSCLCWSNCSIFQPHNHRQCNTYLHFLQPSMCTSTYFLRYWNMIFKEFFLRLCAAKKKFYYILIDCGIKLNWTKFCLDEKNKFERDSVKDSGYFLVRWKLLKSSPCTKMKTWLRKSEAESLSERLQEYFCLTLGRPSTSSWCLDFLPTCWILSTLSWNTESSNRTFTNPSCSEAKSSTSRQFCALCGIKLWMHKHMVVFFWYTISGLLLLHQISHFQYLSTRR